MNSVVEDMFIKAWEAWHRAPSDGTRATSVTPLERDFPVGRYKIDFAHVSTKTAVEIDGMLGHSTPEDIEKDRRRQRELEALGWSFIRFGGREVKLDTYACVLAVSAKITHRLFEMWQAQLCSWCRLSEHEKCLQPQRSEDLTVICACDCCEPTFEEPAQEPS